MSQTEKKNDANVKANAMKTVIANVTTIVIAMIHKESGLK